MSNPSPAPLCILIVEDDRTSRFVLLKMLQATGNHEIHEAEDGQAAWEKLNSGLRPNLCFLDLNMPRLNGLEFLRLVRADPRFTGIRVCFCSAVRDTNLVIQAAVLKPDDYILKPYSREVIQTQVHRALGLASPADSLESARAVCARLNIDQAAYDRRLETLVEHVRGVTVRLPTLLMQFDLAGVLSLLDRTGRLAQDVGARRILKLSDVLRRAIEAHGGVQDSRSGSKEQAALQFQQWLSRAADQLMQTIQDFRTEVQTIERVIARSRGCSSGGSGSSPGDSWDREQSELSQLTQALAEAFGRGRVVSVNRSPRSRSLEVPVNAAVLGQDSARTLGGLTRKTSFSFSILNPDTIKAIEETRKVTDLVRLLSFPIDNTRRWIPEAAQRLLDAEIADRAAHGIALLRTAIGPDLEGFLRLQEIRIRENLVTALRQSDPGAEPDPDQVQSILREVRKRIQTGLAGSTTSPVAYSPLEVGCLNEGRDDAAWAIPFSLLRHAAEALRQAVLRSAFDSDVRPSTFGFAEYVKAMNVFGDEIVARPRTELATEGLQQIASIADSPVSLREKCRLVWGVIHPASTNASPAPAAAPAAVPASAAVGDSSPQAEAPPARLALATS